MLATACRFLPSPLRPVINPTAHIPVVTSTTVKTTKQPSSTSTTTSAGTNIFPQASDNHVATDTMSTSFDDYQSLFISQRSETAEPITLQVVEGSVPRDFPTGTYYLVGPGILTDDHGSTVNPLDGHGYLRAFSFVDGSKVRYSARYIATEAQREERDEMTGEWRFTHRGPFSVLRGGRQLGNLKVMKNVANTSVVLWGGRLLCLWEGGHPYEVDPETLDTVGPINVFELAAQRWNDVGNSNINSGGAGGIWKFGVDFAAKVLKPILYGVFKMPHKRILSHYKIDCRRKRLLLLSCNAEDMLLPLANFTFYEFDAEFKLVHKKEFSVPDHLMIHDWCFTDNYYIIVGNRVKLDVSGSLLAASGVSPMISSLTSNPSKSTSPTYLLPRFSDVGARDWRKPIEASSQTWVIHMGNGFEERDDDGNVKVQFLASGCSYKWLNLDKMFGYNWRKCELDPSYMNATEECEVALLPHLVKVSITLDTKGSEKGSSIRNASRQWSRPTEFPAINHAFSGERNAYTYANTTFGNRRILQHFPFDSVAKLDLRDGSAAMWSTGSRRFVGEPVFVPRGEGEDNGYILVIEYAVSDKRCYLVILDARLMGGTGALVAKLEIPKHLTFPLGFHGFWAGG